MRATNPGQSHDEAKVADCHAFKRRDDVPALRKLWDVLIYHGGSPFRLLRIGQALVGVSSTFGGVLNFTMTSGNVPHVVHARACKVVVRYRHGGSPRVARMCSCLVSARSGRSCSRTLTRPPMS